MYIPLALTQKRICADENFSRVDYIYFNLKFIRCSSMFISKTPTGY